MGQTNYDLLDDIMDAAIYNNSESFKELTEGYSWIDIVMSLCEFPGHHTARSDVYAPYIQGMRLHSSYLVRSLRADMKPQTAKLLQSIESARDGGVDEIICRPFIEFYETIEGYNTIYEERGYGKNWNATSNLYIRDLTKKRMKAYYSSKKAVSDFLNSYRSLEITRGFHELSDINTVSKQAYQFIRRVYRENLHKLPDSYYERFKYKEGVEYTVSDKLRTLSGTTGVLVSELGKEITLLGFMSYYLTHLTGPYKHFRKIDYSTACDKFLESPKFTEREKELIGNSLNEILEKSFKEETLNVVLDNLEEDFYVLKLYLVYYTGVDKYVKTYQ